MSLVAASTCSRSAPARADMRRQPRRHARAPPRRRAHVRASAELARLLGIIDPRSIADRRRKSPPCNCSRDRNTLLPQSPAARPRPADPRELPLFLKPFRSHAGSPRSARPRSAGARARRVTPQELRKNPDPGFTGEPRLPAPQTPGELRLATERSRNVPRPRRSPALSVRCLRGSGRGAAGGTPRSLRSHVAGAHRGAGGGRGVCCAAPRATIRDSHAPSAPSQMPDGRAPSGFVGLENQCVQRAPRARAAQPAHRPAGPQGSHLLLELPHPGPVHDARVPRRPLQHPGDYPGSGAAGGHSGRARRQDCGRSSRLPLRRQGARHPARAAAAAGGAAAAGRGASAPAFARSPLLRSRFTAPPAAAKCQHQDAHGARVRVARLRRARAAGRAGAQPHPVRRHRAIHEGHARSHAHPEAVLGRDRQPGALPVVRQRQRTAGGLLRPRRRSQGCVPAQRIACDLRRSLAPPAGCKTLGDSLAAYTAKERLCGDNQYRCSVCDALVDADKGVNVTRLAPILILSLRYARGGAHATAPRLPATAPVSHPPPPPPQPLRV